MKNLSVVVLALTFFVLSVGKVNAQMVGDQIFLPGQFVEVGVAPNGSLGSVTSTLPSGYYSRSPSQYAWDPGTGTGSTTTARLMMIYDAGHDGWTTGTPTFFGDYSMPGTPYEAWSVQAGGTRWDAQFQYLQAAGATGFTGGLTGTNISYTNSGGQLKSVWQGTASGGNLQITQTYTLDTTASWLKIKVRFKNLSASTITGVYYMRHTDPDNDQTSSGSFNTRNIVDYQNDYANRVQVSAWGTSYTTQSMSLSTKDCRAKAFIGTTWPTSTGVLLSAFSAGTAGGAVFTTGTSYTGDYAIGLVFNIGDIAAGDSATINFAYVFNGTYGLDSAITNPSMVVLGTAYDTTDTVTSCTYSGDTIGVTIANGAADNWAGSTWTWAPSTGLIATTGLSSGVLTHSVSAMTTYTITGTSSSIFGGCAVRHFYLTVLPATSVPPPTVRDTSYCLGASSARLTATGLGIKWYTTAIGGVGSTTGPIPSTAVAGTFTWWVTQTVAGCESPRVPIHVTIIALPGPITGTLNVCVGLTTTLADTTTGGRWSSSIGGIASVGLTTGVVTGNVAGTVTMTYTAPTGCFTTTTKTGFLLTFRVMVDLRGGFYQ